MYKSSQNWVSTVISLSLHSSGRSLTYYDDLSNVETHFSPGQDKRHQGPNFTSSVRRWHNLLRSMVYWKCHFSHGNLAVLQIGVWASSQSRQIKTVQSLSGLGRHNKPHSDVNLLSRSTAPFSYIGMRVGSNMSRCKSSDLIIKKMEDRLSTWKAKTLSIGGRLTLMKSVLGSLPLYFLSVFCALAMVVKKIESLRLKFFSGKHGWET